MSLAKKYEIEIVGETPLLMHKDNIAFKTSLTQWSKDPINKKKGVAGDDRSPAWTWIGCLYEDGKNLSLDSDSFMTMLREAGAYVANPNSKRGTMKRNTQSGLQLLDLHPEFYLLDKEGKKKFIPYEPIQDMIGEEDFDKHVELVESLGFELFLKRAKVGLNKHVRVRPMFTNWGAHVRLIVTNERFSGLSEEILSEIWQYAGSMCGLCDWRPSSRTPGQYGMFKVKELKRVNL